MDKAIVINRLIRWSYWKMRSGVALSFPSQVSYVRLAPSTTYFRDPGIDIECSITNDAFERLPVICQAVLKVQYISTARTSKDKALLFGRTERRYFEYLAEAHGLMGAVLDEIIEKMKDATAYDEISLDCPAVK